jgi:hypothetical protein
MRLRQCCRLYSLFCAGVVVISSMAAFAQIQPDRCATATTQAGDVSVRLSLKNGQTVFREGEIITLAAEYSSSSAKKYYLSARNYDRSGRLGGMEVICIEPDAGHDPLSDYFNGAMGFIGGGLGSEQPLSEKSYPVDLELNEWKSLPPGTFRLSIVSYQRLPVAQPAIRDRLLPLEIALHWTEAANAKLPSRDFHPWER